MDELEGDPVIRCQGCGYVFATIKNRHSGGYTLHIRPLGLELYPTNPAERRGEIACVCGRRVPVDLGLFGYQPPASRGK